MNRLLIPAAAVAAAIAVAAPAQADDADRLFDDILSDLGATDLDRPLARQQAIEGCLMLNGGFTMGEAIGRRADLIGLAATAWR